MLLVAVSDDTRNNECRSEQRLTTPHGGLVLERKLMDEEDQVEEFGIFNEVVEGLALEDVPEKHMWLFNSPLRNATSLVIAKALCAQLQEQRDRADIYRGRNKYVGKLVIRKRVVIRKEWEDVRQTPESE